MTDRLISMLDEQLDMQGRYGYNFKSMSEESRIRYIKDMYIAAVRELGEALDETSWKTWTTGTTRLDAEALTAELTDAFQFIMNMWFAALPNHTPEELANLMLTKLQAKLTINEARRVGGYDGVSTKCVTCKRALDDPAVACYGATATNRGFCSQENSFIHFLEPNSVIQSAR